MKIRVLSALCVLLAACTCGEKKTPTDGVTAPTDPSSISLSPLPVAPNIDVAPESLPGAGQDLAVVASRPQGAMEGEVRPTVTFSKPVKMLEVVETQRKGDADKPFAKIEPKLEGEWRWLGSASAEFVPKGLVPLSTEFKVTIFAGLKAIDGSELKQEFSYTFSTPPLEFQSADPQRGFRWVTPDQTFTLLTNQPVDPAELMKAAKVQINNADVPNALKVISSISIQDQRRKDAEEAAKKAGRPLRSAENSLSDEDRGYRNQQMRYTIGFNSALPLGGTVTIAFDPSLHGSQGPLPMRATEPIDYRVYGPMKLESARFCLDSDHCSYGPLVIMTSNEADLTTLKDKLKVTPAVELDWENADTYLPRDSWEIRNRSPYISVPGKWKPGTQYKIEIAAGVADTFKQAAAEGLTATVRTNDLTPALITGGYFGLVEKTDKAPVVPVEVSNLKTLNVKMWKLEPNELAVAVSRPSYSDANKLTRPPDFTETEALKYPRNQGRVHPLQLSKVFKEAKTGIALVSVNSPDLQYPPTNGYLQLVQVTDLAAHIKIAPKKSLVWVTRLSTGAPEAGVDVTLFDERGANLWAGKTDADGFADVPGTVEMKLKNPQYQWEYPFALVTAGKDGDLSMTANTWASGVEPYEFGLSQGWEGESPQSSSMVFTDRGIYRPGDTVYVKGVMRYRVLGELRAPAEGSMVKVTITDSRNDKVIDSLVKVTKYGTFSVTAPISKDAPTGYFSIDVKGTVNASTIDANANFRVEEYRAPQFRVDVSSPKKSLVAGEAFEASVSARYLFGGAMNDANAKWSVHRETTTFHPESAADFTFSQETWWWNDEQPEMSNSFFASGEGRVDATGALQVKAGMTEALGEKPYTYTLEAEVTDVNRQAVAGRTEVTVHPAAFYVGLKSNSYFLEVNKEYPIDTLVTDVDGKRTAGRQVEVTIVNRTWKSVRKKDATGGFSTISEPSETEVAKCALTSSDSAVPCKFKPTSAGFFIVKASVEDDAKRKHVSSMGLYASGSDWVAWQRNDTDRVELITDKTKYDVGDVAKVLIKSPYPTAKALLTVEREGVLQRRLLDLKGSVVTVEIPVTEDMVPNVFAGVVIMRPRVNEGGIETGDDPGRPNARIGLVRLNVERKAKRLTVNITTDKKEYQPREKVAVDLSVKDIAGKGASGEITLYVVDEAVLRLTNYQTPDPIEAIFPDRPLSVRLGEPLLHLVRRRNYGEKGEPQGGGGGAGSDGAGIRTNFKTTVLFNPTLELKDGVAKTSFELPDNLTSFRIMAVVITLGDKFGSGETSVQVNKPVMALPAMPRFARVGDVFEAGVVVHAHGPGAGDVTVTAKVEGGAVITGEASKTVPLKEGSPKEVRFTFKAEKPGLTSFTFKATNGVNSDGVLEKIPLELPVEMDAVATYGDTTDSRVEGIVPPKDVYGDMGGLTVSMTSTSLGNFQQGFQQLIDYPYGCLEQQSSRLVPFVALREIAGQFKVPWPGPNEKKLAAESQANAWLNTYLFGTLDVSQQRDPDEVIKATVKSIVSLQAGDGSFRYWPTSFCSSSWTSAYATMSLSRARDVGFAVPPETLKKAEEYLTKVAGGTCSPCEYGCDIETRVFASYVLARMKKPKPSNYAQFFNRRKDLSLFGQALLANAMYVGGGDRKDANTLMTEILNFAKESPKGVHIEEVNSKTYATYFHSDTRTTGVVLQALTDISPDHPFVAKMAHYLTSIRQGDGQWRSTQEASFSLMALTEVVRTKEKDTPDFSAKLAMGSAALFEQAFKGRSMTVQTKTVPMAELLQKANGQEQKLTFSKEGPGVLYYSALLKYAPKEMPTKSLDNGLFVQRWFEPYTGGGQATRFFAGDLIRIRLRVASNQERHWTAFEVPLPAGIEAVDTSLATTAKLTRSPDEESRGEDSEYENGGDGESGDEDMSSRWAYGFWSPFVHTEMRDNRVIVFADHLPPGVHVVSFVARATTPGTYVLKPAKGTLMYEPEVWGRSEGGTFEVAMPASVSSK